MPASLAKKINPRVDWPRKAVHALADRSIFNGYTCADEQTSKALRAICESNQLERLYRKNLIGELKHCCGFWTVTDGGGYPVISAYPATAAAALWDDARKASGRASSWLSPRRCPATPSACRPWCTCSPTTASWCSRATAARG